MWSGPRNISTALMRSFDARADAYVCDEPFYAHYLRETGLPHPMAEEIQKHHDCDAERVAHWLTGPIPNGARVFYQKHMAHHLLPTVPRNWIDQVSHAFLIREPRQMLASLLKVLPDASLRDTGLTCQVELFEQQRKHTGRVPAVVDSADLLRNPAAMLEALCESVGIPPDPAMLTWKPGPRPTDGCWAPVWYGATHESTGFAPWTPASPSLPEGTGPLLERCEELYQQLAQHRIVCPT